MKSSINNLINTLAALACGAVILALMVPAVARQRNESRAAQCANNLKRIGLAIHNYHSAFKQLPPGTGGTEGGKERQDSNQGRLGPLVSILPFIEEQPLWEMISNPYTNPRTKQSFPPMGPVPWFDARIYEPWALAPQVYSCPDRPGAAP
ncbi:MAG: DUF1559 domain-containing protein, partial [Pirellulales bacterium]|nr:DUF1559 domain-containing protein [Pirellulales bacterium]